MELRHLRYFIAVAEEENVSRAALKLHVSQPGLSRQIRDLEDELGFPLLERTAKSVKLTEAGWVFFAEARDVIRKVEEAVAKSRKVAKGGGELRVGYAPSLTVQILPKALRAYEKLCPGVRVSLHDLSTEEMLGQLRTGKLDAALMVQPGRAMLRGISFRELACYPLCLGVASGHPLAKKRFVDLKEVAGEPLIGYNRADYPEYHELVESLFAKVGAKPRLAEEHDGVTSLAAAVEVGRGVALVPASLKSTVGNRLKLIPFKPVIHEIVVGLAWKGTSPAEPVAQFLQAAGA